FQRRGHPRRLFPRPALKHAQLDLRLLEPRLGLRHGLLAHLKTPFYWTTGRYLPRIAFRCMALHHSMERYILSGKRGMNPSRFGILTLGRVCAFISSFSPISLFCARMYAVRA